LELGFVPGTHVRCISRNSLYDTITVRIRGATICLRTSDAGNIKIK
jgi:Fe2+ transport system protein FeoA